MDLMERGRELKKQGRKKMNGKKISDLRERMGLSRKKFGALLGRSDVMIWHYERESKDIPVVIALAIEALELKFEAEAAEKRNLDIGAGI